MAAKFGAGSDTNTDSSDMNIHLGLLVVLLVTAVVTLAYLAKYNAYSYSVGIIAACFLGKDLLAYCLKVPL